jgi:anaerobic selenocysteine-containing dehydrogenase
MRVRKDAIAAATAFPGCSRERWQRTDIDTPIEQRDIVQLITLRSNDQFNTTVYGYDDRFRGIHGTRMVVLKHRNDMAWFALNDRDMVSLTSAVDDGKLRTTSRKATSRATHSGPARPR